VFSNDLSKDFDNFRHQVIFIKLMYVHISICSVDLLELWLSLSIALNSLTYVVRGI